MIRMEIWNLKVFREDLLWSQWMFLEDWILLGEGHIYMGNYEGIIMYNVSITILDYDNRTIIDAVSFFPKFIHFADFKLLTSCNIENKEVTHYQ